MNLNVVFFDDISKTISVLKVTHECTTLNLKNANIFKHIQDDKKTLKINR